MYIKFPTIQRFGKQKENKHPKSAKGRVKSAASRPGSGVTDVSSVPVRGRPGSSVAKLGHVQKQASEALAKVGDHWVIIIRVIIYSCLAQKISASLRNK